MLEPVEARGGELHYEHDTSAVADVIAAAGTSAATAVAPRPTTPLDIQPQAVNEHKDIGRNDPCWCGSGKKYKRCHGA